MNNTTAVDVFLGHPLVDATEKQFLARLRRDLVAAGVRARVLANVQLGKDFRQIDFVIVTDARAAVVELKGWRDALVAWAVLDVSTGRRRLGRIDGRPAMEYVGPVSDFAAVPLAGRPPRRAGAGTRAADRGC